jgi:hypothetical protein
VKLYEIDQKIQALVDGAVDEETGEVVIDLEALQELQMEREKKLEGIALVVKNMTAEADAIRAEEKKLADRRRVLENKTERLKGWLAFALNGEKLATPRVSVSVGKAQQSVVVDDIHKVEEWYFKKTEKSYLELTMEEQMERDKLVRTLELRYPDATVSKAGIKKLLADYEIPGVHLEDGKPSLRIR